MLASYLHRVPSPAHGQGIIDHALHVYILECRDRTLYVGSTWDLDRLAQHQGGEGAENTRTRRPVRVLYYEDFDRIEDAFHREKQIQGWGRAKRLALVEGDVERLNRLSRKPPREHGV
ncbi:GIY-YIG nuclease family protein [Microbacterium sp. zg.B48]|uniref:GIY-YIG nuclease family protein n=1 Tax=Microbacterium sp. zg.B48 TaxID=2969408 RepID=UPI00214CCFA5|nr:GIY-YIG nuclease family protein [Microbacterium sp. zg.B48]MCR2762755.1 GIY-YIG nuclease family protein [Microbacterium sp. zg.B48]